MEKYENLGMVGEGSYGMVIKCKHKETGQVVAIKKFLESEDDKMVKKIAMREVKMLRKLRHENLVNLIEVFRRRRRLHLVFEFVDHTILDDLEKYPKGLSESTVQRILWQVLRAVGFIHSHNIIHRDIKPENILHSRTGLIKLCDFGFARTLANPGEIYTDYVATRWYRAPELLVGDAKYGRAVDVWAIGCLIIEMLTGDPLFPGDSDIDQLYKIMRCFGNLCPRHRDVFYTNPLFAGMSLPEVGEVRSLERRYPRFSSEVHHLMKRCMKVDPNERPPASSLLNHKFFQRNSFADKVLPELRRQIHKENVASCGEVIRHNDNSTTSSADGRQTRDERGRRKKLVPKDGNNHTTTQQQQLSKSKSMVIGSEASWKKKKKLSPSHKLQISDDVGKLVIDNKFPPYNSTTNHHYNNSSAIPGVQKLNSSGDKHTTTTNSNTNNKQKNNNSSCLSPPFQQNYNSQQQQQQTTTTYNQYRSILPSLVPPNHSHQHNDSLHPSGGVNKPSPPPHTPASIYSMRSNQDPWTAHTTNKPSIFRTSKNHHHHQVLIPPIYHHNHHQHTTPEVSVFPLQVTSPPPNSSVSQSNNNKKQQQTHHFLASNNNGGGGETASSVSLRSSLNATDLKLKKHQQHQQQNKKKQQQNNQQSGCDINSRKDENDDEVCRNTLVFDQAERGHVTSMLNEKGDHHQHEVCDKSEADAADVSSEAMRRRGKVSPTVIFNNNNNSPPHNASSGVAVVDDKRRQDDFFSNKSSDLQQSHSRKSE